MSSNKKVKRKIKLWCEGKTEIEYFKSLLKSAFDEKINITFEFQDLKGSSYGKVLNRLKKEAYSDFTFVVLDLDRASDLKEQKYLDDLVAYFKKDKLAFLFFTYKNFEDWIRFHFKDSSKNNIHNICTLLGYKDVGDLKSNASKIYEKILHNNGSYENAKKYFKNLELYCGRDFKINKDCINKIHSNLHYILEIIEDIKSGKIK